VDDDIKNVGPPSAKKNCLLAFIYCFGLLKVFPTFFLFECFEATVIKIKVCFQELIAFFIEGQTIILE
jgi:hypothetical protein